MRAAARRRRRGCAVRGTERPGLIERRAAGGASVPTCRRSPRWADGAASERTRLPSRRDVRTGQLKRRTPPGCSPAQSSTAAARRSNARASAASLAVSDHQRSPVRPRSARRSAVPAPAQSQTARTRISAWLSCSVDGGDHLAPAAGGVRPLPPGPRPTRRGTGRRRRARPRRRASSPSSSSTIRCAMSCGSSPRADAVVGAALELDRDAVGAAQDRAVAPGGALDELDVRVASEPCARFIPPQTFNPVPRGQEGSE